MAQLLVSAPEGAERKVALAAAAVSMGRADECDVVLGEGKASRRHCRVEPKGDGWRVVDEGSSNGTWLGGKPVLAARLKPGDEIEIGDTVITFVDESAPAAPREPRRPRPKPKSTPWGVLFIPALAAAIAFFAVGWFQKSESADASAALTRFAKAEIERASFQKETDKRAAALAAAREKIERLADSDAALALIDEAAQGPRPTASGDAAKPRGDDWRAALDQLDADKTASASERRSRLADLVERHFDDAAAVKPIRERLTSELTSAGDRVRIDREQTFAGADAAAADGRYGQAIAMWTAWVSRAPSITAEDDHALAGKLADAIEKARAAAQQAAAQYESARREGRKEAAQSALDAAVERLRGTGFDVWLAARGGAPTIFKPGSGATPPEKEKSDDPAARNRAEALRVAAAGEELARQRRFADAAAKIDEAAAVAIDAGLKGEIAQRAVDLRTEAAFVEKLLGWVAADTKKFSPLKLGDRQTRVDSANGAAIVVLDKDGNAEPHPIAELPSSAFTQLVEKAGLDKADFVAAAVLLHDIGEQDAYVKWMRAALSIDEMRMDASQVHARCTGTPCPVNGFMPHPDDARAVVTYDQWKAIKNAAKIAALRADLLKIVDRVEKSHQAKQVDNVRRAYAKLEEARKYALDLIFDEVKYFYPYRDRMKEYMPVERDVEERVKAVREIWEDKLLEKVRTDANLIKASEDAEKIVTDIQFYGGDPSDLVQRIENVRMYLGHDLSVQTFFENQHDVDLMAYNEKVMRKFNPQAKGPTEPEREQVRITNEYRMMLGHRRALRIHASLVTAARGHSEDMGKLGFFAHESPVPGKTTPSDRVKLAGYDPIDVGENIYEGGGSPEAAHDGWIHSSGHHRNILDVHHVELGSGNSGKFWTQDYGARADDDWEGGLPK